MGRSQSSPG
ncbi:hypothetical protein LINPERPRIM_LOCUS13494 [Linum perenne]